MTTDPKRIALEYIDCCSRKDHDAVARLLAPDVEFTSPASRIRGATEYLAALRRISRVWVRSDVRKVFTDGDEVCVIYDFVTDTAAGDVRCMEWLRVEDGRVRNIRLLFDRVAFKPVSDALAERAARAAG